MGLEEPSRHLAWISTDGPGGPGAASLSVVASAGATPSPMGLITGPQEALGEQCVYLNVLLETQPRRWARGPCEPGAAFF